MPEQHGLHLNRPLTFSIFLLTLRSNQSFRNLDFDTLLLCSIPFWNHLSYDFRNDFFYWAGILLMIWKRWKKKHKTTKKRVQYPCFSYKLEMCLCCNKCDNWKIQKRGVRSFYDTCAAAWKNTKNQKRGWFICESRKIENIKKTLCLATRFTRI